MKALLAIVSGFVLTLAIFVSGLAFATWLLTAKPAPQATPGSGVAELWTKDARPVNKTSAAFERVAGKLTGSDAPTKAEAAAVIPTTPQGSDANTTAAIQPAVSEQPSSASDLPAAHVEWCARRYQSYHPSDNSYNSYSGRQRPCISPYLNAGAKRLPEPQTESVSYVEASTTSVNDYAASGDDSRLSSDHVQYCFRHHRSYRPQDNSYQPYSGGPRRQCE